MKENNYVTFTDPQPQAYIQPQAYVEQDEGEQLRDIPAEKLRDYSTYICHNCKRVGHIKKQCKKPRAYNKKKNSNRVTKPNMHIAQRRRPVRP
ncbi:hypothetical protein HDV63DRAFT_409827 [Trichoderma sp. SZMC 28014]